MFIIQSSQWLSLMLCSLFSHSLNVASFPPMQDPSVVRQRALRQHSFFQLHVHLKRGQDLVARDACGKLLPQYTSSPTGDTARAGSDPRASFAAHPPPRTTPHHHLSCWTSNQISVHQKSDLTKRKRELQHGCVSPHLTLKSGVAVRKYTLTHLHSFSLLVSLCLVWLAVDAILVAEADWLEILNDI